MPDGFKQLDQVPDVPGLTLKDGAAFGSGDRAVLVGSTDAKDATLLPASFKEALGLLPGDNLDFAAVKLGPDGLQAFRYPDLAPKDFDKRVTVYASPNSEGVMTVACLAPAGDSGFKGQCESVADTMKVSGGKAFPVGPDPAYAKLVGNDVLQARRRRRQGHEGAQQDGASFRAQAAAARDIQAAYGAAAKRLRGRGDRPGRHAANAALVTALDGERERVEEGAAPRPRARTSRASRAPRARSSRRGRSSPRRSRACRPGSGQSNRAPSARRSRAAFGAVRRCELAAAAPR